MRKLERICQKLALKPSDHLLEIGTGWGSMAIYAATHYGCKVTTTTLSREQFAYTQQRIQEQGLQGQITLLLEDYRDLAGQFDKLVSIEMVEAIGAAHAHDLVGDVRAVAEASSDGELRAAAVAAAASASFCRRTCSSRNSSERIASSVDWRGGAARRSSLKISRLIGPA